MKEKIDIVTHCNKERLCIHIEATHLVDGTYELMPAHENESQYARVNLTELIQGPDQSLEELKASNAQYGKPWCI